MSKTKVGIQYITVLFNFYKNDVKIYFCYYALKLKKTR